MCVLVFIWFGGETKRIVVDDAMTLFISNIVFQNCAQRDLCVLGFYSFFFFLKGNVRAEGAFPESLHIIYMYMEVCVCVCVCACVHECKFEYMHVVCKNDNRNNDDDNKRLPDDDNSSNNHDIHNQIYSTTGNF